MIILDKGTISKIDRMKHNEKLQIGLRTIYVLVLIIGTLIAAVSGRFEEFSRLIVICVISTYVVGIICDCARSDFDTVLQILEYDRSKWAVENVEPRINKKTHE